MKSSKSIIIGFLFFAIFCLVSFTSQATVMVKLSDEAMVDQAGSIVTGRVMSVRSEWNDERTKIFTYITILPQNYLKGEENLEPITIKQPGGQVGNIVMQVHGISVFQEGEEVFVFLKEGQRGFHRIIGWSQGKRSIETDPDTQRKMLVRKRAQLIRTQNGKIKREIIAVQTDKKTYLDDFKEKIQNIVRKRNPH